MTDDLTPLTDDDLRAMREKHVMKRWCEFDGPGDDERCIHCGSERWLLEPCDSVHGLPGCDYCNEEWPCMETRLLDLVDALRAENTQLLQILQQLRKRVRALESDRAASAALCVCGHPESKHKHTIIGVDRRCWMCDCHHYTPSAASAGEVGS